MAKTFAELEQDNNPAPPAPIKEGTGEPTPQDLLQQQQQQQQSSTPPKKEEDDVAAAARIEALKAKAPETLTDEEKEELKKLEGTEEETPSDTTIWEDVDALRGEKIEINWESHKDKDGNPIDPDTPEGIFIREKYIEQRAVQKFEENLSKTDPRGYAYFLHRQAGGTDEEFFSKKTITLPEYDTFKESVDLQQKVYAEDLRLKNVPEKQIKLLIDQALKDKELLELADAAYKSRQAEQQKEIDAIAAKLKADNEEYDRKVAGLSKRLSDEITTNTSMNFLIPEAKKAQFSDFVRNRIQYLDGKFFAVQELDDKEFGRVLEGLYLQMVNGDISGLIKRAAQTQNVKKLQKKVQQSAQGAGNSGETNQGPKKVAIADM